MRKRFLIISILAIAVVCLMAGPALADHSPTFYVEWDQTSHFTGYGTNVSGNLGTGSPHQGYLEGTEKCGVCHSVHRAPVPGLKWDTNPAVEASRTAVAGGQYNRQEFEAPLLPGGATTQLLLQTDAANSCNFCHVDTAIGNKQLYAGDAKYINSSTNLPGSEWDEGYGHHNGCTGCHAVHGTATNYGDPALYGQTGVFKGAAIASKVLKVRAKGTATVWQDEVITAGVQGKADAATLYGTQWANLLTSNNTAVDTRNIPLFPSATDAINGTNVRPGADMKDAQVSAFCTFCHQNYGSASEATVNPDGDRSLFQGPWYALANTPGNPNVTAATDVYVPMGSAPGQNSAFKNHPLKGVETTLTAAGASSGTGQVAFMDADTCRSCHDAGVTDVDGVIVESFPHFTPGYFHFTKSGAHVGAEMSNDPVLLGLIKDVYNANDAAGLAAAQAWLDDPLNYEKSSTVQDGQCLKCHVNATDTMGVGKTF